MAKSAKIIPFRYAAKPIVIRQTKVVKHKAHRKHGGSSAGGFLSPARTGIALGGFLVGFIQKMGWQLPKLPMIGEAGTIALGAYLLSQGGKNKIANEVATAALAIAAYELGSTGQIVGGDAESVGGYVAGV